MEEIQNHKENQWTRIFAKGYGRGNEKIATS